MRMLWQKNESVSRSLVEAILNTEVVMDTLANARAGQDPPRLHIYIYIAISTRVVLLDTGQSTVMVSLLDLPVINMLNSRRMRLSVLKLLSAGVELEKVISHWQLMAKLSNLEQNRKII